MGRKLGEIRIDSDGNIYTKENNSSIIEDVLNKKRKLLKMYHEDELDEYLINKKLDSDDILYVKEELLKYEDQKKQKKKVKIFGFRR